MSQPPNADSAPPAKRPTIRDVASRAGVSKSLVSLVYSNPDSVSAERTARVLGAAADLGFEPNIVARSLAGTGGDFIAILVADLHNPVFADIVDAARAELARLGRASLMTSALLLRAGHEAELDNRLLALFRDLRPRGILVVGSIATMSSIVALGAQAQLVVASAIAADSPTTPTVRGDDVAGMRLVVDHLVGLGHTRIAHAGGEGGPVAAGRASAYEQAMAAHGLQRFIRVEPATYSEDSGHAAAERLLSSSPPTAVTAVNDLAAVGVLAAVAADRERTGAPVSVTGYDNTFVAALRQVSLTTVDPNNEEIGARAAAFFSHEGRVAGGEHLVAPRLRVRSSTGPVPLE